MLGNRHSRETRPSIWRKGSGRWTPRRARARVRIRPVVIEDPAAFAPVPVATGTPRTAIMVGAAFDMPVPGTSTSTVVVPAPCPERAIGREHRARPWTRRVLSSSLTESASREGPGRRERRRPGFRRRQLHHGRDHRAGAVRSLLVGAPCDRSHRSGQVAPLRLM